MSELDSAVLEQVAVFPLPRLVLFPGTTLPLHFFEPRYREMMEDTIASGAELLVVAQLADGWREDYEGRPPIFKTAGLGRIKQHRKNDDGTHDVLLEGVARVKLEELPEDGKRYRRASATVLHDAMPAAGLRSAELGALRSLATQVVQCVQKNDPAFRLLATVEEQQNDPARFIDKVADQLVPDPDARQQILETLDVATRLQRVSAALAQLHLALLASDRDDGDDGDDGGGGERVLH